MITLPVCCCAFEQERPFARDEIVNTKTSKFAGQGVLVYSESGHSSAGKSDPVSKIGTMHREDLAPWRRRVPVVASYSSLRPTIEMC